MSSSINGHSNNTTQHPVASSSTLHQPRQFLPTLQRVESSISPTEDLSRKPSPIRDLVTYMSDLPSLSDVKAGCDCYADECGDLGISLQLCYVSRGQLNELWLQLCSMQITKLQLAFLYAILANVGISTPAGHPQYSLDTLLSGQIQEKYIAHALGLLNEVEAEVEEGSDPHSYMQCHLLLIITSYQQCAGQYQEAWNNCKRAVQEAHKCRLFYIEEWKRLESHSMYNNDIQTIQILQGEMYFLFNWMAYIMESLDTIPFDPNFPPILIPPVQSNDPIDGEYMSQKMQSCTIAHKGGKKMNFFKEHNRSQSEALKLSISLDDEVLKHLKSQHQIIQNVLQYSNIDISDRGLVSKASTSFLSKGGLMLQRWRLAQTFYEEFPLDVFLHTSLSSARSSLQMLPVVERCCQSPWQTITVRSWADGNYNQALYIFLSAIKTHLFQENSLQASTSDSRYKQAIRGELIWFMSNFNQLYETMNKLGMVRTVLAQCATALKETPVELIHQLNKTKDSSAPSPNDSPFFQLSKDCDFQASQVTNEIVSNNFRNLYNNHSVFKLAVEAHSSDPVDSTIHSTDFSF